MKKTKKARCQRRRQCNLSLAATPLLISLMLPVPAHASEADTTVTALRLRSRVPVAVIEPSGLTLDLRGGHLWTVSDKTNRVYKLDFEGVVLDSLAYVGKDLEGVVQDATDGSFWVVEERLRQVVHLDARGRELARVRIPVKAKKKNNGLEGICVLPGTGRLFVVNQKSPGLLLELDRKLSVQKSSKLTFAENYSGVTCDPSRASLWIVSAGSRSVVRCDLSGAPLQHFRHEVPKAEGIAIDPVRRLLFLISDSKAALFTFDLPD